MQRPVVPIEADPADLGSAGTGLPLVLKVAVWLVTAVFGGSVLMVALLAGHFFWAAGHRDRAATRWGQALDLSMPALWPLGESFAGAGIGHRCRGSADDPHGPGPGSAGDRPRRHTGLWYQRGGAMRWRLQPSPVMIWAARELLRRPVETVLLFGALSSIVVLVAILTLWHQGMTHTCNLMAEASPTVVVRKVDTGGWAPMPAGEALTPCAPGSRRAEAPDADLGRGLVGSRDPADRCGHAGDHGTGGPLACRPAQA